MRGAVVNEATKLSFVVNNPKHERSLYATVFKYLVAVNIKGQF